MADTRGMQPTRDTVAAALSGCDRVTRWAGGASYPAQPREGDNPMKLKSYFVMLAAIAVVVFYLSWSAIESV